MQARAARLPASGAAARPASAGEPAARATRCALPGAPNAHALVCFGARGRRRQKCLCMVQICRQLLSVSRTGRGVVRTGVLLLFLLFSRFLRPLAQAPIESDIYVCDYRVLGHKRHIVCERPCAFLREIPEHSATNGRPGRGANLDTPRRRT